MNGLLLPSGSSAPIRGDTLVSPVESEVKTDIAQHRSTPSGIQVRRINASLRSPTSSRQPAASLAFIPSSSRSTANLRKPVHQCSEFELEQMLDRNERILATLEHSQSQAQTPTKQRLTKETESLRDAIRSIRAVRDMDDGVSSVRLNDPSAQEELESALDGLSVDSKQEQVPQQYGSSPTESFGWSRDTLAVKKKLAQNSATYQPGRKVQAISYEQSVAIQTAALLGEMERERKAEEHRLKTARERGSLSIPSGAAHKLGRKSISSSSGSMRKGTTSLSTSPARESRAAGILAQAPQEDAQLEGGDSDQDNAADMYAEHEYDDDRSDDGHLPFN